MLLAMILSTSITTRTPVDNLRYYANPQQREIAFEDVKTKLTRVCAVGQYGIYFPGETAYQIAGCRSDTIFKTGHEFGETNRPELLP